jgi:hypothetical protein
MGTLSCSEGKGHALGSRRVRRLHRQSEEALHLLRLCRKSTRLASAAVMELGTPAMKGFSRVQRVEAA